MNKTRLEAFSDGMFAIIITIMVLELKVPDSPRWADLAPLLPKFGIYVLSFVAIGSYWISHHHLVSTVEYVNGKILWANLHMLFWISLIPFVTGWIGADNFSTVPVAVYGMLFLCCTIASMIFSLVIMRSHTTVTELTRALSHLKNRGTLTLLFYLVSIPLAFVNTALSCLFFIAVAVMWIVPNKQIEKALSH